MKKILSLFVFLPIMVFGQTGNYVKNTTYKVATATSIPTPTAQQAAQTITYYDGLGRPIQQVAHQQSGSGKDIVTPIEYDGFGRQDKEYLPYVPNTPSSLDYKPNALTDVLSYYDATKFDADFPGMVTSSANPIIQINPYSQKGFEASPLNRVLQQAAPGKDWKLGNGHEIRLDYQTNTDADLVRQFGVSFINGNTEDPQLQDNGIYAPSQLYKTITKDENWIANQTYPSDHTTEEFKDKEGRVILKRTFDAGKWHDTYYIYDDYGNLTYVLPPKANHISIVNWGYDPSGSLTNDLQSGDYQSGEYWIMQMNDIEITFNLYWASLSRTDGAVLKSGKVADLDVALHLPDMILGNIIGKDLDGNPAVAATVYIQNNGLYFNSLGGFIYGDDIYGEYGCGFSVDITNFQNASYSNGMLNDLIYQYKYDKRNRLVEKKLPGKEWEYIVYDKLDRPVLTQDANLKTQKKWLFTKYDAFSRPVYTGEYVNTTAGQTTRAGVQALADTSTVIFETKQGQNDINGTTVYYSNNAFPNTPNINLFTINYYDDYNFDLNGGNSIVPSITNAKGLTTGSKVRVLGTSSWITNVSYYDGKSRPIYSYTKNDYLATISTVQSQLDFVGKTLETTSTHQRNYTTTTVVDKFTYDQVGRLTKQTQAINGATTPEVIVFNTYDELGQLTSKKVGGKTTNGLQKVDYAYNIRGWLKNINNPNDLTTENDLFGFGLNYNAVSNQNTPLYNGNISSTLWKTNSLTPVLKQYNYIYDALNRLKNGRYAENNVFNSKFNETINGYDRNGNILSLDRYMTNPYDTRWSTGIDYLVYTYDSGNRLMKVDDMYNATYSNEGFKDGTNTDDDYRYDANGNMTIDKNKGIIGANGTAGITYNHLNLPTNIKIGTGTIDYVYDATGVKQRKIVSTGTTTDYAGGFQYEKIGSGVEMLKFFPQPEGYVEYDSGNFNYIYQYKDHLGNVRLSYKDVSTNNTPQLQIITESSYYPFGLEHKTGNNMVTSTNPGQKYKYNGKELQDENIGGNQLNVYDYGWRDYDPAIGRFNKIDRFAEKYIDRTPYNYAANNPVYYIDVAGDSLYVSHHKGFLGLGKKETLRYENGNLYNKDGSAYQGKTKGFLKQVTNALAEISKGQEGSTMINELQSSNNNFTIEKGSSQFNASDRTKAYSNQFQTDPMAANSYSSLLSSGVNFNGGSGGTIFWNSSGSSLPTTGGMLTNSTTDLAHEMFHGLDANRGLLDDRVDNGIKRSEWQAVFRENTLRTQLGLPLRTHYQISDDQAGNRSGTGPRMLTPSPLNQPIRPAGYR